MGTSERLQWTGEWDVSDGGCRSQMLATRCPRRPGGMRPASTAGGVCSHTPPVFICPPSGKHETWNTGVDCVGRTEPETRVLFWKDRFWFSFWTLVKLKRSVISWEEPELVNDDTTKHKRHESNKLKSRLHENLIQIEKNIFFILSLNTRLFVSKPVNVLTH